MKSLQKYFSRYKIPFILSSIAVLLIGLVGAGIYYSRNKLALTSNVEPILVTPQLQENNQKILPKPKTSTSDAQIMAWMYPGAPACSAIDELKDGREIDVIKPEYLRIDEQGDVIELVNKDYDCNGYSREHATQMKELSRETLFMVSGRIEGLKPLFASSEKQLQSIEKYKEVLKVTEFDGLELDFEDYGSWTDQEYNQYKQYVKTVGDELHKIGKKLSIDVPAIANERYQSFYKLKYQDFVDMPVDYFTIMTYDFQYDEGVGTPVASFQNIKDTIEWVSKTFPDKNKVVIGLNNYGYYGNNGEYKMKLITSNEVKKRFGDVQFTRDPNSGELIGKRANQTFVYSDSQTLDEKKKVVESLGYSKISVWHLGGNDWFSNP